MEDKITITEQSFQRLEEKETEQVTGYRHSVERNPERISLQ